MAGKQSFSGKNDTYTDRNGDVVHGMRENGFTSGNTQGLLASDISSLLEVRENNTQAIVEAIDAALAKSMEEIGLVAEGYAKKACPVDTGRLRNSITHVVRASEKAVYIGTNVEYGPYVELGTRHMKAQPYLRPAASGHKGTYRAILKKNLGGS